MQNKIIRIMNFKQLKDKVQMCTLYKSMNILLINDIFELEVAKFMHSFCHRMLPENFDYYFKSGSTQHSYNTRGVITGCSLSSLRARKLLGKKFFLANAFFGITGFSELANSLGK